VRQKNREDEESICARASTLLTIRRLSSERQRNLLLFLCEAGLIRKLPHVRETESNTILELTGADLKKTDLSRCALPNVDLSGADLRGADLRNVGLTGANLKGADLNNAKVTDKQLATAKSLSGATMPNGSIHP